jgi:transcriptional regulator with XRE-family HTH domain
VFGDRLKEYLSKKRITGREAAQILGIRESSLSQITNNKYSGSIKLFEHIIEKIPETDQDKCYLATGIDPGKKPVEEDKSNQALIEVVRRQAEMIDRLCKRIEEFENKENREVKSVQGLPMKIPERH